MHYGNLSIDPSGKKVNMPIEKSEKFLEAERILQELAPWLKKRITYRDIHAVSIAEVVEETGTVVIDGRASSGWSIAPFKLREPVEFELALEFSFRLPWVRGVVDKLGFDIDRLHRQLMIDNL